MRVYSGTDEDLASLVWADDFQAVLRSRQLARAVEVQERRERMDAGEDESQRLHAALAAEEAEEERVVELSSGSS